MTDGNPLIRLTTEPGSGHMKAKRCPRCGAKVLVDAHTHVVCEQGHRLTDDERRSESEKLLDRLGDRIRRGQSKR